MLNSANEKIREMRLAHHRSLKAATPLIMGVLNITPDSFSDGGKFLMWDAAETRVREMIAEGADIIDIGGESTRPGSDVEDINEELERVVPAIKAIRRFTDVPISIDTTKAEVARQSLSAGADIINDISAARFDSHIVEIAKEYDAPIILMHMLGNPKSMQSDPYYDNCVKEIVRFFSERVEFCLRHGLSKDKIIIDPGIGFGKRLKDNIEILQNISEFKALGYPLLLGASRKSFIGMITGKKNDPEKRIGGSIASALIGAMCGADILRVHDVAPTIEAIKVFRAIEGIE